MKIFGKKIKILISALLIMAMVVEWCPIKHVDAVHVIESDTTSSASMPDDNVFVQFDGKNIDSVSMKRNEQVILSASTTIGGDVNYKWEILVDKKANKWVPIYEADGIMLSITYGMLVNFLDDNNMAQIRASVTKNGDKYISDRVVIGVEEEIIPEIEKPQVNKYNQMTTGTNQIGYNLLQINGIEPQADITDGMSCTLTINYIKDTGEQVCDPYIATIYKGMPFKTTVLSPVVPGYEPKLIDGASGESYEFNYDSVETNAIVDIYYHPIEVKYEVRYYMQGVYDDNYTLNGSPVIAYGMVGTEPDRALMYKEFDGFVKVNHYPEVIAADGSTVFQCFYDRKYCLVDLDLNGGHGIDSVYAKYGTAFIVNQPQKPGYVFAGWDGNNDGAADNLPATVPADNTSYKAIWKTTETSYTVVFWYENANDDKYSVAGIQTIRDVMSGSPVNSADHKNTSFTGRDNTHFTYNDRKAESKIVEGDGSTVLNVYYTRNKYTMQFRATGLCGIPIHEHDATCSELICTKHVHDGTCTMSITCGNEEHEHNDDCLRCIHEHELSCWQANNRTLIQTTAPNDSSIPANPISGTIYSFRSGLSTNYYLYFDGLWYCGQRSNGNARPTYQITMVCNHQHDEQCYIDKEHQHTQECETWSCGQETHEHDAGCLDSSACTIVSNHTHTTNCNNSNRTNVVKEVTRKWNADLSDIWPITDANGVKYDDGQRWSPSGSSTYSAVLVYISVMPGENFTLTVSEVNYDTFIMHYMVETLPGETGTKTFNGKNFTELFVVNANYNYVTKDEDFFDLNGFEQYGSNPTFGSNNQLDINGGGDVYFYYSRNSYNLSFYNYNSVVDGAGGLIPYDAPLTSYKDYEPGYPSDLEANAYEFDGWYTTEGCYDGTKFDFDSDKMPSDNLILYAKWAPVKHTVTFYNTYQDMENKQAKLSQVMVSHGDVLKFDDIPDTNNAGYTAGEWFYIKNGEKVAYQPLSIAVKEDLDVYREWTSSTVVEYTVHYYKSGTTEKVADSSHGWVFDGMTKTFKAKGGGENGELYQQYLAGWYPTLSSTSIVADVNGNNTVIFYYEYQNPNPYTVKYIDTETGAEIANKKVVSDNAKSVVTEVYKPVDGYIPDAYYKQLILALNKENDSDKNVITFYYTKATNSAYYAVEYYFMNPDGTTYALNAKIQSPIAIGAAVNIPEIATEGFEFEKCWVKNGNETEFRDVTSEMNNIMVSEHGALVQVYYKRLTTSYTVHHYISGTTQSLKPSTTHDGIYFGNEITEYAGEGIEGYTLISDESQTKELLLDASMNEFIFYYNEKIKTATYKAIVRDSRLADADFGFVSHTMDVKKWFTPYDEVTATAKSRFYFNGWYSDAECSNKITDAARLSPTGNDDVTYYVLFEPYYTDLTIKKTVDELRENQTFVFTVVGTEPINDHISIDVTIHGNGEIRLCHLPLGQYDVVEQTTWAWKYDVVDSSIQSIELDQDPSKNIVEFQNKINDNAWLGGDDYDVNIFN